MANDDSAWSVIWRSWSVGGMAGNLLKSPSVRVLCVLRFADILFAVDVNVHLLATSYERDSITRLARPRRHG